MAARWATPAARNRPKQKATSRRSAANSWSEHPDGGCGLGRRLHAPPNPEVAGKTGAKRDGNHKSLHVRYLLCGFGGVYRPDSAKYTRMRGIVNLRK